MTPRFRFNPSRALTYLALGCWALVCLFPLYWVAVTSLKGSLEIVDGPRYLPFVDFAPSWEGWKYILFDTNDQPLLRFENSIVVGLGSTAATILLASMAVYGLTRFPFAISWQQLALLLAAGGIAADAFLSPDLSVRLALAAAAVLTIVFSARATRRATRAIGSSSILVAMMLTRVLPPVAIVLPLYLMAARTGLLDTRFALILTYTASNLPVAVWLLLPVLGVGASEVEEAAQLDGASRFRILFEIAVPAVAGGVLAAGLLVFILCWNEYLFSVYLADNRAMTMPPFLASQMSVREQQAGSDVDEWIHLSAAVVLMTTPMIFCAGLAQRFLGRILGSRF